MRKAELNRIEKSFLQKVKYWWPLPISLSIKGLERIFLGENLFDSLLTRNSKENQGIDMEFIMNNLAIGRQVEPDDKNDEFQIYLMENTLVCPKSGIMRIQSGHFFAPLSSDREFLSGNHADKLVRLKRARNSILTNSYKVCYVLPIQQFYYHFIVDELPRLIRALKYSIDLTIVTSFNQPNFVKEFLSDAKIDFILEENPTHINQSIIVIPKLYKPTENKINMVRDFIKSLYSLEQLEDSRVEKVLFISRQDAENRYDSDAEDVILASLKSKGKNVQLCISGKLTLRQQVMLFSDAKEILAVHGGGLTNMIFMPRGGYVTEYFFGKHKPYFYRELSKLCDHSHEEVLL